MIGKNLNFMARSKKDAISADETPVIDVINEPKDEIIVESAPEVSKTSVKTDEEGIAELNRKLKAAEEANSRLERERNEAVKRAYAAKTEVKETNDLLFNKSQADIIEHNKYLKSQYAFALQNDDFAAAADIQEALALNQAKALQIQNGRQALKEEPPLDPVEAMASQLSPRSAAWVRAHPDYASNERLKNKMINAHNIALDDGFAGDTDDYFARVEEILRINQRAPTRAVQDDDEDERFSEASRPTSGRQTAPSAIPVSRDVSTSGTRQRTIRLSAAEAEAAELSGISHEEYARNRDAYRAERGGRLN
jgi:hypothetical protein